ncbi:MAG TPA: UrcA family protein [Steroidobacteraceae bacterium]|nr:UrcA family protein [Steroidobacteraceae bacterium]
MIRTLERSRTSTAVALAIGGLLFATCLASLSARAGSPAGEQFAVKTGDLDLTREEGVKVLYQRLQFAAQKVCGQSSITGTRLGNNDFKSCVKGTVDDAVRGMNKPALTAYHRAHAGQTEPEKT